MTQQEQIRKEQEAQIAAPRKPYQGLIQSISNIFHPLLVLTYTALVICIFTAMRALPFQVQAWFVGMVFLYTLVMPVLVITLLHVTNIIGHWALRDRAVFYQLCLLSGQCHCSYPHGILARLGTDALLWLSHSDVCGMDCELEMENFGSCFCQCRRCHLLHDALLLFPRDDAVVASSRLHHCSGYGLQHPSLFGSPYLRASRCRHLAWHLFYAAG